MGYAEERLELTAALRKQVAGKSLVEALRLDGRDMRFHVGTSLADLRVPVHVDGSLGDALRAFRDADKLMLGICNGFQALLKAGLLIAPDEEGPLATLAANASGRFEDRWIYLKATPGRCPFLTGYDTLHVPVAHGENIAPISSNGLARVLYVRGCLS